MDWTRTGPEEVAPGVHRIPLPLPTDGLRAVNVYAIVEDSGVTLIDGGWRIDAAREALRAALSQLGVDWHSIERCLVTHHHRDHYTLAVELRELAGLVLALGKGEQTNLQAVSAQHRGLEHQITLLQAAGAPGLVRALEALGIEPPDAADFAPPDVWLDDGELVDLEHRTLRVLATPGHTTGHVVFVDEPGELVFSGDHILPHITPSVGFEVAPSETPLAHYLRSLAAMLDEPDRVLLPAHGPAGGSAHRRVEELLEHHDVRLQQTGAAVKSGSGSAYEVANALTWTRRQRQFTELDPFNQMLAVNETIAHLEVLQTQGQLDVGDDRGVVTYSATG